jgi:uncharacterized RDD family membrane protein YckC
MGDVYEAEQVEQGRLLAVKVLNRRLAGQEDRARFLREGQLAASINHPHSVYIFGSEEIDGTPAISMELLAGGTLKDRVRDRGPLPPAEAVEAMLQVIAGLAAMQAAGVLHRDIKPANCFVDRDGTVKVGDFGLSIATMARDVSQLTAPGTFHGTPEFASPEQLRGDPLDLRADIYGVGATLYYLLTGQPPFDDRNLVALVTRIATEVPRSPRGLAPAVPRGLAAIVLGCLAKDRAMRPASYAALHDALRAFSSAVPTPATMRSRFLAGAIDEIIVSIPLWLLNVSLVVQNGFSIPAPWSAAWWYGFLPIAMRVGYFGIAEGLRGAAIGKQLMGLRVVVAAGRQHPGVARASWRALMFHAPAFVPALAASFLDQARLVQFLSSSPLLSMVPALATWTLVALCFSTARRRNGLAGIHDLCTRTRVVRRLHDVRRPSLDGVPEPTVDLQASHRHIGPFDVIGTLGPTDRGTLWLGFDPRLHRRVWIHELPPGAPAIPPLVRDLNRPGRLRWLGGRRTTAENWDAYERLDGRPLISLIDRPLTWDVVRLWLADLAREIDAGLNDGSIGGLEIDRLWITRNGRAKLLDFRVPGEPIGSTSVSPASPKTAQTFLGDVASSALTGHIKGLSIDVVRRSRLGLPMSASALLDALDRCGLDRWSDVVGRIVALADGPVRVTWQRRAATIVSSAAIPLGLTLISTLGVAIMMPAVLRAIPPEIEELSNLLNTSSVPGTSGGPADRTALELYIAGRFGPMISRPQFWADPLTAGYLGRHRRLIERIIADHPNVSPDQLAAATAILSPFLERHAQRQAAFRRDLNPWLMSIGIGTLLFMLTALVGILSAWLFRGGLFLRAFDIAVVSKDGTAASRWRASWRGAAAWGLAILPFWFAGAPIDWIGTAVGVGLERGLGVAVAVIFAAGAAWAVAHPERGLQDRIAGTYLVLR